MNRLERRTGIPTRFQDDTTDDSQAQHAEVPEIIAQTIEGESCYAHLKVRLGGKAPMAELECRVVVTLDKIHKVPEMITETMDKMYTQAQDKNLLF